MLLDYCRMVHLPYPSPNTLLTIGDVQTESLFIGEHGIANDAVAALWWLCSQWFLRRLCAPVRCIPLNGRLALRPISRSLLWIVELQSRIPMPPLPHHPPPPPPPPPWMYLSILTPKWIGFLMQRCADTDPVEEFLFRPFPPIPRRGGSNEYPQSMFLSRNKKNNVYPCKPQFYYIKMGFKGVNII